MGFPEETFNKDTEKNKYIRYTFWRNFNIQLLKHID